MIGLRLTDRENGEMWVVTGQHAGIVIIAPLAHGPVEYVSTAVLASRFGVEDVEIVAVDETAGWERLASHAERTARLAAAGVDLGLTPEEQFDAAL